MHRSFFQHTLRFEHLGSETHKRLLRKNRQSKGVDLWNLCDIEPFEFPFSFPAEKRPN